MVFVQNQGQEYANGRVNNYNEIKAHKGHGGKFKLKVRGDFLREQNSQSQLISSTPAIAKDRSN